MMHLPSIRRRRLPALALGMALGSWLGTARADLSSVIAAARSSVLPVGTYSATDSPRFGFRGSGFIVGDGSLLVTNFHVLPTGFDVPSGPVMAVLASRQVSDPNALRRAQVLATDRASDLALLRLEGPPLAPLDLDEAGAAREGQSIAVMGFPIGGTLGFAPVTHRGIIASITTAALPAANAQQLDPRAVLRLREGNVELFQLDATAYPGNSGGPVLDAQTGRVLGVLNMVLLKAGRESALSNPTGISYAVPVRSVHALLKNR